MDDFLRDCGLSEAYGTTYVLVPEPGAFEIIAYYTLAPDPYYLEDDDSEWEVVELKRLAVASAYQGHGIGRRLMTAIAERVVLAAQSRPIQAFVLEPLDPEARKFYHSLNFGFVELPPPNNSYMVLPIDTMRRVFPLTP